MFKTIGKIKIAVSTITAAAIMMATFAPAVPEFLDSRDISTPIISLESIEADAASYSTGKYAVNTSSGVNVRTGAGSSYSRVGAATNGTVFTVTQVSGNWGKTSSISCTNGTKSGWVCLDYCKYKGSSTTVSSASYYVKITAKAGLNVRNTYSTSGSKVTAIPYNTTVKITKTSSNGWGYCTYNGKSGWISLSYTAKTSTASTSTSTSASTSSGSVKLNVNTFKQGDSRWKNTYIGTKTIGQVGCLVTALAMVYSYKNNTTVYPNAMKSKLSFSNNAVYWSSVSNRGFSWTIYNGATINQTIMKTIYNKLKAGKPVILGATNYNGNEHWVVITGYSGSTTTFTPSGFSIIDPGYNKSNLQQHLNYVNRIQRILY